jgi:hypothetical protein
MVFEVDPWLAGAREGLPEVRVSQPVQLSWWTRISFLEGRAYKHSNS